MKNSQPSLTSKSKCGGMPDKHPSSLHISEDYGTLTIVIFPHGHECSEQATNGHKSKSREQKFLLGEYVDVHS